MLNFDTGLNCFIKHMNHWNCVYNLKSNICFKFYFKVCFNQVDQNNFHKLFFRIVIATLSWHYLTIAADSLLPLDTDKRVDTDISLNVNNWNINFTFIRQPCTLIWLPGATLNAHYTHGGWCASQSAHDLHSLAIWFIKRLGFSVYKN